MAKDPKKFAFIALGLVDYLRDRWEDLRVELERRGEERAEDINDFWDDVLENISSAVGQKSVSDEWEEDEDNDDAKSGMVGLLADLDVKGIVNDFMDDLGLARHDQLEEIGEQLDRIGRAIDNL